GNGKKSGSPGGGRAARAGGRIHTEAALGRVRRGRTVCGRKARMALRLVTGRSGSGKTRYILNEIHKRLQEDPAGPLLLLLVPEQATFQTEQALVAAQETGGSLRAQVLSFRRLAHRIMQETGGSAVVTVGELGRAMLIRRALAANRERLRLFRADTHGPAVQMTERLSEWTR